MVDRSLARLCRIAAWPATLFTLVVLVVPVASLLATAFGANPAVNGIASAIMGTIALSFVAATLSTAIALAVAVACRTASRAVQNLVMTVSAVPLSLSALITAFAFILLFGRSGTVTLGLSALGCDTRTLTALFYGPLGLTLIYLHMLTPRALNIMMPVVAGLDMTVFDVARSLGAKPWRAARDTLWPQVARACLVAWSLCFAVSVGSYAAALVLLGTKAPLLAVLLVAQLGDSATNTAASGQIAAVIVALCLCGALIATFAGSARRPRT